MKMERAVDVALVVGVIAVVIRLGFFSSGNSIRSADSPNLQLGSVLRLPPGGFNPGLRHVVLVIDTDCEVCKDEAERYAKLAEVVRERRGIDLVVVAPRKIAVLREWLKSRGVTSNKLVSTPRPIAYGFLAYPTIVLTDEKQVVTDLALGAQTEPVWEQLFKRVRGEDVPAVGLGQSLIDTSESELSHLKAQVVDARNRAEFATGHLAGAVNIPADELETRAPVELLKDRPLALSCLGSPRIHVSDCRMHGNSMLKLGFASVFIVVPGQ